MATEYAEDYSIPELLACFLGRQLEDNQELDVGANTPIATGAVLLAHFTHAPNAALILGYCITNLLNISAMESFEFSTDYRQTKWAEMYIRDEEDVVALKRRLKRPFFVGAVQVDKYGNCNLIGVGEDYKKLKFRGPGAVGTSTICDHAKCFYILLNSHDRRIFVEKCDYVSLVGWGEGGPDARKKLGLPGGGPKYCLTPLCIMDFEEKTKRMRLKSVHPGVTVQQVVENTAFELIIPQDVPTTEPPTKEELRLLRDRIDPQGLLRS